MLKKLLILGGIAVGGYYGYRWWSKKKAATAATAAKTAATSQGEMYIPGLDPMAERGYYITTAPLQGPFGASPVQVIY